ncbi:MAG: class II aldolase/adducin family protein [Acutalibacteraceae bacterium]
MKASQQEIDLIKSQICDVCHKMWQLGWVAANDGNVSALLSDGTVLATPTGMSKSFITPEKLVRLDRQGNVLEAAEGLRPSSEIKMHLRCYDKREDVFSVIHAHPPGATGFAVAHRSMDMYNMIEDVAAIGSVPLTPYGTPSTAEVPDAIEPYLEEHDVMLLENHGALAVGSDVITAFYRMESLELWAKITINAIILGGSHDISRENIDKLINLRKYYQITGRHPGYKKYPKDESEPTDR